MLRSCQRGGSLRQRGHPGEGPHQPGGHQIQEGFEQGTQPWPPTTAQGHLFAQRPGDRPRQPLKPWKQLKQEEWRTEGKAARTRACTTERPNGRVIRVIPETRSSGRGADLRAVSTGAPLFLLRPLPECSPNRAGACAITPFSRTAPFLFSPVRPTGAVAILGTRLHRPVVKFIVKSIDRFIDGPSGGARFSRPTSHPAKLASRYPVSNGRVPIESAKGIGRRDRREGGRQM